MIMPSPDTTHAPRTARRAGAERLTNVITESAVEPEGQAPGSVRRTMIRYPWRTCAYRSSGSARSARSSATIRVKRVKLMHGMCARSFSHPLRAGCASVIGAIPRAVTRSWSGLPWPASSGGRRGDAQPDPEHARRPVGTACPPSGVGQAVRRAMRLARQRARYLCRPSCPGNALSCRSWCARSRLAILPTCVRVGFDVASPLPAAEAPVVLVHGLTFDRRVLEPIIDRLGDEPRDRPARSRRERGGAGPDARRRRSDPQPGARTRWDVRSSPVTASQPRPPVCTPPPTRRAAS
jgi:hypothetical protein